MKTPGTGRRALALLGAGVVVAGSLVACGNSPPPGAGPSGSSSEPPLQDQDAAAYQRWVESGIDDYRFSVTAQCFCVEQEPLVVTVRDGQVVSVTPESARYWREVAVPVPDQFAAIAEARDQYATVEVTYDAELGYPRRIAEDRIANATDDEVTFFVSDFQQLPD